LLPKDYIFIAAAGGCMPLASKDYKAILEIINIIYSVHDKGAMFAAVSQKLQQFIGIYSSVFAPTDYKTGEYHFEDGVVFNNSEKELDNYLAHYVKLDPFITSGWYKKGGKNKVERNTAFMPKRKLLESEFGCDFLLRNCGILYCLATTLVAQGDMVGTCGFHRQLGDGDFSNRDKEIVNIILPHIANSIRNFDLMMGMELHNEPGGIIAIDEDGKPFYMNAEARRILKGKPLKIIPDPGLDSSPIFFKSGACSYRTRTVPLGMGKNGKVILLESHPPEYRLHSKFAGYNLSKREEEIAVGYTGIFQ